MRILYILPNLPYPPDGGALIRHYNLIKRVAKDNEVSLAAFTNNLDIGAVNHLKSFCEDVIAIPTPQFQAWSKPGKFFSYLSRGIPVELRFYYIEEMIQPLEVLLSIKQFDIVDMAESFMGEFLNLLPSNRKKHSVLTMTDIIYSKFRRMAHVERKIARKLRLQLFSRMMQKWEPSQAERFGCCITMSEKDKSLLQKLNPRIKVEIVPNGFDTKSFQPLNYNHQGSSLIFVGNMDYLPNVDGMLYFCKEIFPLVREKFPSTELWIVGTNPRGEIIKLEGNGIFITGHVEEVTPYYERSTVCVAPLRAGSGTRLKILESMSLGRPVVSTTIGCEGLQVTDGNNIFIADKPQEFAEKIIRLLSDYDLWQNMSINGRNMVEQFYDWDLIARKLLTVYSLISSAQILILIFYNKQYVVQTMIVAGKKIKPDGKLHDLVWVYPGQFEGKLSAMTWLGTVPILRTLGWDITLISVCPEDKKEINGVEIKCISRPDIYFIRQVIWHLKVVHYIILLKPVPDIVIFQHVSAIWLLPIKLFRRILKLKKPLIVIDTQSLPMSAGVDENWKSRLRVLYMRLMSKIANLWADGQTANTIRMARAIKIPEKHLLGAWHSGVNIEQFAPARKTRNWNTGNQPIRLIYIGSTNYERNVSTFSRAVEHANQKGMAFSLDIIGSGSEQTALEKFTTQTQGRIKVLPAIAHKDIPHALSQAHIGVLPFPDEEKFQVSSPVKLFEYMASGLVILATQIVCHTDVIENGKYVFWVEGSGEQDFLDTLKQVWDSRDSLQVMGDRAANAACEWTWEDSTQKLNEALNKLLLKSERP